MREELSKRKKMKYRILGKTNIKVSEIGFGAWAIGGTMWGGAEDAASLKALRSALDLGVNFIDTAAVYGSGRSEQLVGKVVRERKEKVAVATKIPPRDGRWPPKPKAPLKEVFPSDWIRKNTEKSLRNLRIDCLDLQQLHVWSPNWVKENDWFEELIRLKQEGKIKNIGVSINDHRPDEALELVASGLADTIQVIYNIFDQSPEDQLLPLCREKNVGIIARVPLDEGALTGKFTRETRFPDGDFRQGYFSPQILPHVVERVERLKFMIRGEIQSLAIGALKFCLSHPAVSSVISGIRTEGQAKENCSASDGILLKQEILEELKKHRWIKD